MDGRTLGWLELTLVFGLVLGLGVWQLWSLRREQRRDAERAREAQGSDAAPGRDARGD
jgi:ABC-type nickel/cobalt efflux system permease component RcnA